ncbi:MAG: hypothetical protein ACRD1T_20750 [Acidimicrobiia bacterium]
MGAILDLLVPASVWSVLGLLLASLVAPRLTGGTKVTVEASQVVIDMLRLDNLWALRGKVRIPLAAIESVRTSTNGRREVRGIRLPVVFDLKKRSHTFNKVVVEVSDPEKIESLVRSQLVGI